MKIQIDINERIIILLDPVTFSEIDGVMKEIKNLIKDDLNQWKIQTDNKKEDLASPVYPPVYPITPVYPHQPFNPNPPISPFNPNPFYPGYPFQPFYTTTLPGTYQSMPTDTNINNNTTCKTHNN